MIAEHPLTLTTADGVSLEGWTSGAGALAGVVVCHPHPLYGGDMDNPVVVRAVEVAAAEELATLRFNFRGVGGSSGRHGQGVDERADVAAALSHLRQALATGGRVGLVGYSFGAAVSAHVAQAGGVDALALVAPPLGIPDLARLPIPEDPRLPVLVVAGTEDEYCPPPALDRLQRERPHTTVRRIEGANHFFFGKLFALGEALREWARALRAG
jgi:alpha/beta superfamily hydrolase